MATYSDFVRDGYSRPIPGATARLFALDGTTLVATAMTGADGQFVLSAADGKYLLEVSFGGVTDRSSVLVGDPPEYVGPPGADANSYPDLASLKAASPGGLTYNLRTDAGPVTYAYVVGDFTGKADDLDVVELGSVPLSTGALKRSSAAERVSLRDYVRFATLTNGKVDWSTALSVAVADLEANPTGGTLTIPAGIFRFSGAGIMRPNNPIFDRPIRIRGEGIGATEVWPIATGDIMFNLVGRNFTTIDSMTIRAGAEYQAYAGIVCARTLTSNNCNSNKFRDLHVIGNFSAAPVISIAAESAEWHNVTFEPAGGSSGVALILGSKTNTPNIALTVPGVSNLTPENANTDICFLNCRLFNAQVSGRRIAVLSGGVAAQFENCAWIAPGASAMVRFCDPTGGIIGGGVNFLNCHFEGDGDIFSVETPDGATYLRGIRERGCTIVTGTGSYLNYDRTDPSKLLVVQESEFRPGAALSVERTGLVFFADIVDRSVVDFMQLGPAGPVIIMLQAQKSRVAGFDVRCWNQTESVLQLPVQALNAPPTHGVYPKGHFVENGGPSALNMPLSLGDALGWVALVGGSVDPDPGGMTITTVTGSARAVLGSASYNLYDGARLYIGGAFAGPAVIRTGNSAGTEIYLSTVAAVTGTFPLMFSGEHMGRFAPVGVVGGTKATAQPDSTATTVAELASDFNALLSKFRAAGAVSL
ncbi:carboxypeptidase-like regulatory domain-containing protein [Sphingomonas sp. PP-CC-3G-468]|uniref:carboxypeptidase-like regulatory domain-containing protein n=1 Tax=Sphingomonas sp. PP-CC-3G-468 TaxID=2135656 RepID=UPI0010D7B482|nr:carboxypeptidase-like regulatory domain-containing protein [Sphingomonas sp. PP-CC-3G-468]TCM10351.1 hypothetical protein C8J41_101866 [Sphingomonas sp. PP-CC-3G-468]